MKLIKRDTDYAIRALCFIAKGNKRIVSVKELALKLGIPKPFLRKILQRLNKRGLLTSYKGKGGGFLLARPASKISIPDIIKAFQGQINLCEHIFRSRQCPSIKTCNLKKKMDNIESQLKQKLNSISIASLLK